MKRLVFKAVLIITVGALSFGGRYVYGSDSSIKQSEDVVPSISSRLIEDKTTNKPIRIKCTGDSITAGMGMPDAQQAVLDGMTYPSILYAMLDKDGVDVTVENAGHNGETTATVVARLGGADKLYFSEDIVFDNSGRSSMPIDGKIIAVYQENIRTPITFNYTSTDINPVIISGKEYTIMRNQLEDKSWKSYVFKSADNTTEKIKSGTELQLSGTRNNTVNIIFTGGNDATHNITLKEYVTMLKCGSKVNGDNCIIIGPYFKIYNWTSFVSGATEQERRNNYIKEMRYAFGDRFIDLESEWFDKALTIATEKGFLKKISEKQMTKIQSKLDKGIIPAEFTYDGKDGNIHLNEAGYTVLAQIVYDKLCDLGYVYVSPSAR